jgi:CubicO group peptidase (beta-lactamase class C family)
MKRTAFLIIITFCFCADISAKNAFSGVSDEQLGKIIADFDGYVQKTRMQWNIPGMSVCVVVGDKIVYKKSFGVREVKKSPAVDNKTVFQIASCTKPFTAVLTAMLVDYGYFSWDDKVVKYLPDFRLYDKNATESMTIESLLSQNSGLPAYSQHLMMLFGYDKDYIVESMRYIKPENSFGVKYAYQNNMYLVLEKIIEKVTGKTWQRHMKEMILKPLDMRNTTLDYNGYAKSKNKASGHYYASGTLASVPEGLPYDKWPYVFAAASGVNSNIDDTAKWLKFIINGALVYDISLLSEDNFNKLFENKVFVNSRQSDKTKKNYYCMGWRSSEYNPENIYWHAGMSDGQGSYIAFLKDKKIGIAVLSNLPNGKMCEALAMKFFDSYLGNSQSDWSAIKLKEADEANKKKMKSQSVPPEVIVPPLDLKKYEGIYDNILYGRAEVKLEGGVLKFSAGSKKTWITLKHFNASSFDGIAPPGWTFKRPMFVFRVFENSNVNALTVEMMTDGVDSMFRKIK